MHYDVKDSKSKSVLPKMLARFGLVGKILVAPFGSFQVKFPMDWKDANMVEFIYFFEGPRRCQVEINHTTLNSFPIPKCGRQCSDSQMGEGVGRSPC